MASYSGTYSNGFLLYKAPFRESEHICDLLLANEGKIRCRFSGIPPQCYRPFEIKVTRRRGFYSASDFRYIGASLITNQVAMLMGMYLNEILVKLGEYEQPSKELFSAYLKSLAHLEQSIAIQPSIREFEHALLMSIGQAVDYSNTYSNEKIADDDRYNFKALQGFIKHTNGMYSGLLINCIAGRKYDQKGALSVFRQCQQAQIDALLGDKTVNSRAWSLSVFKPVSR